MSYILSFLLAFAFLFILPFHGWGQTWQQSYNQASIDFENGNYAQAISTLEPVLSATKAAYEKNQADTAYISTIYLLGNCHWWAGNYVETEQLFKEYLSIVGSLYGEKNKLYIDRTADLAALYYDLGRYQEAEALYKQVLKMEKEIIGNDHVDHLGTLNNLAVLYDAMGRFEWAEPLYREVITGYRNLLGELDPLYATSINNLAALYSRFGRYEEAEPLLKEAGHIELANNGENNRQYATTLNNLAMINLSLNRPQEAMAYLMKTLEIKKNLVGENHLEYLISLSNLAKVYLDTENPEKAAEIAEKAVISSQELLGNHHPSYLNALSIRAAAYLKMGLYEQAEPLFKQVADTRKEVLGAHHPDYAYALSNLALVYTHEHAYQKAEIILIEAIDNYIRHIHNYFPGLSEKEKEKYFANVQGYFEAFNSFALLQHSRNASLVDVQYNNQLVIKALLLDATRKIQQSILKSGDTALVQEFELWRRHREDLAKYYQIPMKELEKQGIRLDSLEEITNALEKELSARSGVFAQAHNQQYPTWQDVQQVLKKGEAALEMVRFRKYDFDLGGSFTDTVYYAALIVTPNARHPKLVLLENGNLLENRLLKAYRTDIREGRHESGAYQYYWQPLQEALQGVKKLYFSPDGIFHQINPATLFNPVSGRYLLDELHIVTVTSTRDLLDKDQQNLPVADHQAILVGYPDYDLSREKHMELTATASNHAKQSGPLPIKVERGEDLKPLPGTQQEIEQVAQLLDKHKINTAVYLGEQALEETVKQVINPQILHIATHGYFEQDVNKNKGHQNPLLRSGLLLAGAGRSLNDTLTYDPLEANSLEDGILTAYEAVNLSLDQTELVVLSACETGLGEIKNGEGVYGLQRAFKVAGAEAILMSLWKIDDRATQALMISFYKYWLSIKDKSEAFKMAQQQLRQQYPDPYYWGAFLLVGE